MFIAASIAVDIVMALALALMLDRQFRGRGFLRAAVLPWAVPTVVSAMLWKTMFFDPRAGVVDYLLAAFHPAWASLSWLGASTFRSWMAMVTALSAGSGDAPHADAGGGGGGGTAVKTAAPPSRPATKPVTRAMPKARGRQARVMRKVVATFVVLSLTGVTTGAVEIKLHGFSFFVFRNAGAGAGNPGGLTEDQGPGQPDAPKPHTRSLPQVSGASHR